VKKLQNKLTANTGTVPLFSPNEDLDQEPTFHFDADPDSIFHFDAPDLDSLLLIKVMQTCDHLCTELASTAIF
jgi:hypothetical protein